VNEHIKEELLKLFSVSLALVACSAMIYMSRTPSLTGSVVIETGTTMTTVAMVVLILSGLAVVMGAIISVHKLNKEVASHKKLIVEKDDLSSYVEKAKKSGFNDSQITSSLKKHNWDDEEIKKYL